MVTTKFANWGIAYQHGNTIEINKVLLNYPTLFADTFQHELEHYKNNKKLDIKTELKEFLKITNYKLIKEQFKFMFHHPLISLQQLAPVWYKDKEWNHNTFLILFYGGMCLTGFLARLLILKN